MIFKNYKLATVFKKIRHKLKGEKTMITGTLRERVLSVQSSYQTAATIEALENAGLPLEGFALLRSNNTQMAQKVARLINNELLGSTKLDNQLLSLLDDSHFFGPSDWLRYYGAKIYNLELPMPIEMLENILNKDCPFIKGKKVKETHFLFFLPNNFNGLPLTINQWLEIYKYEVKVKFRGINDYERPCDYQESGYQRLDFSKTLTAGHKWYLMFEGIIPDSKNKGFGEQIAFLRKQEYELPRAIEVLSMLLLILEKNKYLIGESSLISGRTADQYLCYTQVTIGTTNLNGQKIFIYDGPGDAASIVKNNYIINPNLGAYGFKKLL